MIKKTIKMKDATILGIKKRRPKLVEDWRSCLRWFSTQSFLVATTIQVTWVTLPDDWRASIPTGLIAGITILCLVAGVIGRLIKQPIPVVKEKE